MSAESILSLPYGGIAASVPGVIEAEEFDTGGEGLAYSDTNTVNKGGEFRPDEAVDIGSTADGYYVGWNKVGEYLQYTVMLSTDRDGGMNIGEGIITMCVVDKRFNLDSFTMEEHV
eukprot:jgi/Undpi1/83/HiC_scaffold_1.g00083.m1